ncbi:MAG: ABC transporter ATP-binding protein [Pseudomonadota bacterium]
MIQLREVSKKFRTDGVDTLVADRLSMTFPAGQSIAVLGRNGAGKSSLLKMIAGTLAPDAGTIEVSGTVSWPVGLAHSFHPDLTGMQNTRFVARIFGVECDRLEAFVHDFSELGDHYFLPFRTYSQGMRARLGFALSMGIRFDTYLIDEITAVGDAAFRRTCEVALAERLDGRGAVIVSHSLEFVRRVCDAGIVMDKGQATWFDNIGAAIAAHQQAMTVNRS